MSTRPLRIETLAIGDELLDGRLADTNSRTLADALAPLGLSLQRATVVDDDIDVIADAVREAAARSDIVVTSGGLGPTSDDLTPHGIARAAGCAIRVDAPTMERMRERFASRGLDMPENNRRQAELPERGRALGNEVGIAPGFVVDVGSAQVWSFPGVPREYRWLLEHRLLPEVEGRVNDGQGPQAGKHIERRTLRCLGITESGLGAALEELERDNPDVLVQYRTSFPENHARLVVRGVDAETVRARADALAKSAREAIGGAAYAVSEESLPALVLEALQARDRTAATAESCTGGLVGARLTDVPGSSTSFKGGVVAYANELKVSLLDVDAALLEEHGAVSEEVAGAMAAGARARTGADFAISLTGVAGPSGGTDDKPVGTVCFGLAGPEGVRTKRRLLLGAGREMIRELACAVSLRWLLSTLTRLPGANGLPDDPKGPVAS
jgi:nicotinamide-nucleotide amidase